MNVPEMTEVSAGEIYLNFYFAEQVFHLNFLQNIPINAYFKKKKVCLFPVGV